jgi:hypothetical protein
LVATALVALAGTALAALEVLAGACLVAFFAGLELATAFFAGVLVAVRFTGFLVAGPAFVAATRTLSVLVAFGGHGCTAPKASSMGNIGVIS